VCATRDQTSPLGVPRISSSAATIAKFLERTRPVPSALCLVSSRPSFGEAIRRTVARAHYLRDDFGGLMLRTRSAVVFSCCQKWHNCRVQPTCRTTRTRPAILLLLCGRFATSCPPRNARAICRCRSYRGERGAAETTSGRADRLTSRRCVWRKRAFGRLVIAAKSVRAAG